MGVKCYKKAVFIVLIIVFPKMQSGIDPMLQTPAKVDGKQLKDLHIKLV